MNFISEQILWHCVLVSEVYDHISVVALGEIVVEKKVRLSIVIGISLMI